ncbi:hypothetical protein KFU94_37915 [Chloroflexi bacterium TSY]|nr:hypothetical protein [Chloroflexi bacterium TSY]
MLLLKIFDVIADDISQLGDFNEKASAILSVAFQTIHTKFQSYFKELTLQIANHDDISDRFLRYCVWFLCNIKDVANASSVAEKIQTNRPKAWAYTTVAELYLQRNNQFGWDFLKKATTAAIQCEPWEKGEALSLIAKTYAKFGEFEKAIEISDKINIGSYYSNIFGDLQSRALFSIVVELVRRNKMSYAEQVFEDAIAINNQYNYRKHCLDPLRLVKITVRAGKFNEAIRLINFFLDKNNKEWRGQHIHEDDSTGWQQLHNSSHAKFANELIAFSILLFSTVDIDLALSNVEKLPVEFENYGVIGKDLTETTFHIPTRNHIKVGVYALNDKIKEVKEIIADTNDLSTGIILNSYFATIMFEAKSVEYEELIHKVFDRVMTSNPKDISKRSVEYFYQVLLHLNHNAEAQTIAERCEIRRKEKFRTFFYHQSMPNLDNHLRTIRSIDDLFEFARAGKINSLGRLIYLTR